MIQPRERKPDATNIHPAVDCEPTAGRVLIKHVQIGGMVLDAFEREVWDQIGGTDNVIVSPSGLSAAPNVEGRSAVDTLYTAMTGIIKTSPKGYPGFGLLPMSFSFDPDAATSILAFFGFGSEMDHATVEANKGRLMIETSDFLDRVSLAELP